MKKTVHYFLLRQGKLVVNVLLFGSALLISGCKSDDPEPINEEELITTVNVVLTPAEGEPVELTFTDLDGDGPDEPVVTPELALLIPETSYSAVISFIDESGTTPEDITEEIATEDDEHLVCYVSSSENLTVSYDDEDSNGRPVGLETTWTTGAAQEAGTITITLRHQPGTKTGDCPGTGDTDVEVTFPIQIGVD